MSNSRPFSNDQLQERLRAARGEAAGAEALDTKDHYARFAITAVPESAYAVLAKLRIWPCHLYSAADPRTRDEVLRWLIAHVDAISWLDKKHAWSEQWHLELLNVSSVPTDEVGRIAKSFERRRLNDHSRRLYARLRQTDRSVVVTLCWLRHLAHSKEWSGVIETAADALPTAVEKDQRSDIYEILIEALLQRGRATAAEQGDGERALHLLFAVRRDGLWARKFDALLERATEATLPSDLKAGRGEATNLLADAYRGLDRAGKWLGKMLGGRDAQVPYSEGVIKSAPRMLASGQVEAFLASSKKYNEEFQKTMAAKGGEAEAAAVAGALSIGGFWTLAQIDDTVLKAMTFSSAGNPDSFWRLREIADRYDDSQGAVTRLSGYVAEQQVAVDLAREGHVVEFPDGATQPGWDLLVDGHPVQVKCSMDADYVMEHFDRYPDIPVVVNSELADQLGDHPMIWVDQGLSHAEVASTTEESVDALANFADAGDILPIPFVAVAFAAVRNFGDLDAGRIDGGTFAQRVGVDVGARTVGGGAGSFIGGAVGSVLGPVGTVIGASIGGFIGSVAGGTGADAVNRDALCDARDAVVAGLSDFAKWFRKNLLRPRITVLDERHNNLAAWAQEASSSGQAPTCVATFYTASAEMLARAKGLDAWLKEREGGDDFARAQAGWVALRESGAFFHPELKARLAQVQESMRRYTDVAQPAAGAVPSPAEA